MKFIIALGNPGKEYEYTRHNIGWLAANFLVNELGATWEFNKKFNAEIATAHIDGEKIIFVKPQTFMNNSGVSVQAILSYYKALPKTLGFLKQKNADLADILTVIHDDLDIEFSKIKTSIDSRSAGHNGVQSIINYLHTKNFTRLRLGIKTEQAKIIGGKNFVLQRFNEKEKAALKNIFLEIKKALLIK